MPAISILGRVSFIALYLMKEILFTCLMKLFRISVIFKPCELVAFVCHVVQINLIRCEEITNKLGKDAVDIWIIKGFQKL